MNRQFPHRVISASAGSGKTFQLVNRFVALLSAGVDPSRIVALTFSRKAAGEMLDKVLTRLAEAAADPEKAEKLAQALSEAGYLAEPGPNTSQTPGGAWPHYAAGAPHPRTEQDISAGELRSDPQAEPGPNTPLAHRTHGPDEATQSESFAPIPRLSPPPGSGSASVSESRAGCPSPSPNPQPPIPNPYLSLLRRLVTSLHRVRISTLDSFFSSVLTAFSFEFGLGGGFSVLDEHSEGLARRRTLHQVLRLSASRQSGTNEFFEAFKQATFGQEAKSFSGQLDRFVADHHKAFLDAPDPALWGNERRIWGARPHRSLSEETAEALAVRLLELLLAQGLQPGQVEMLTSFLDRVAHFRPGDPIAPIKDLAAKLLAALPDLVAGEASITADRRKVKLDGEQCGLALALVSHLIGCECEAALSRTEGLGRILARYEETWSRLVRGAGQLTFSDIQFLLGQAERDESLGFPRLSTSPYTAPDDSGESRSVAVRDDRLFIDYRLDARFDHWLLDEFQDTSTVQWLALKNLVDEVLQDSTGERSLFYVGDVKQAIYGWRGGDSALFHRILAHYNQSPDDPLIRTDSMAVSWRSSQVVLDAVNAVFGHLDAFDGLPATAVARWQQIWKEHKAAGTPPPGFVAHVELDKAGPGEDPANIRKARMVAEILRRADPVAKGLSCAILVRGNDFGRELVSSLRANGFEAVWAGDFQILDNPATTSLLALLTAAEHPGDTQATEFLHMTPLSRLLTGETPGLSPETLLLVLKDIHARGFEFFVRKWTRRMDEAGLLDDFYRTRLEQLAAAARLFDATGEKRVLEFVDHAAAYAAADPAQRQAIQVMTVHKAKGLEFDMVILPELEGHTGIVGAGRLDLLVSKEDSIARTPRWVLRSPARNFASADPTLKAALDQADDDACFEALCLLYVAMTRAKRALYVVTMAPGKSSAAIRPSTLVAAGLSGGSPRALEGFPYPGRIRFEAGECPLDRILSTVSHPSWSMVDGRWSPVPKPGFASSGMTGTPDDRGMTGLCLGPVQEQVDRTESVDAPRPEGAGVHTDRRRALGTSREVGAPQRTGRGCSGARMHDLFLHGSLDAPTTASGRAAPTWGGRSALDGSDSSLRPPPLGEAGRGDLAPAQPPPPLGEVGRGDLTSAQPLRVRLPRATPSGEEHNPLQASTLFLPVGRKAANLGTEVHALFEGVEWAESPVPAAGASAEALAHFRAALSFPAIQAALSRPSPRARAFRERSFEVVLDGRWVTGTFDRLVVDFDETGNPVSAEIQDYKTSRIQCPEDLARNIDTYRPQMAMYRKAATRLLGLPEDRVTCRLLFTESGDVVRV